MQSISEICDKYVENSLYISENIHLKCDKKKQLKTKSKILDICLTKPTLNKTKKHLHEKVPIFFATVFVQYLYIGNFRYIRCKFPI